MAVWRWSFLTGDSLKPHRSILCGPWFWCLKILIFHATWPLHANSFIWRKQLSRLILTQRSASFADWDYSPCSRCRCCRKGLWETAELTFALCVSVGSRASPSFQEWCRFAATLFLIWTRGNKGGNGEHLNFCGEGKEPWDLGQYGTVPGGVGGGVSPLPTWKAFGKLLHVIAVLLLWSICRKALQNLVFANWNESHYELVKRLLLYF